MKKVFTTLLSTFNGGVRGRLLFLALVATTSLSAYDFYVGGIYYNYLYGNEVEVTFGDYNYYGSVTIPSSVAYYGSTYSVTTIGNGAFYACTSLTSVTIPNSVTSIGDYAFYGCMQLHSAKIPANTTIAKNSFTYCHPNFTITRTSTQSTATYAKNQNFTTNTQSSTASTQITSKTREDLPTGGYTEVVSYSDGRKLTTTVTPCTVCYGSTTCPVCHGAKGRLEFEYGGMWYPCAYCGGTGQNYCPSCNGKGSITTTVCSGSGNSTGTSSNGSVIYANEAGIVINGPDGFKIYTFEEISGAPSSSSTSSSNSSSCDYIDEIVYSTNYTGEAQTQVWCDKCKAYRYPHTHIRKRVY